MDFPANPTLNQVYTYGTKSWVWNGFAWDLKSGVNQLATVATTGSYNDLLNKPTLFTTGKAIAMAIVFGG